MQDSVQAFRIQPAVCDDAQQAGHEQRPDTHRGVDAADLPPSEAERDDQVAAEGDQPCPPDKELQEVHHCQAPLNPHDAQSSVQLDSVRTDGEVIAFSDGAQAQDVEVWAHELTHVIQYEELGAALSLLLAARTPRPDAADGSKSEAPAMDPPNAVAVARGAPQATG